MVTRPADFYPAGLAPVGAVEILEGIAVPMERRALTPEAASQVAAGLRARAGAVRALPFARVHCVLAEVHAAWAAPESAWRQQVAGPLGLITGFPAKLIDEALQRLFGSLDEAELASWFTAAEVRTEWLDGGAEHVVIGPELTLVISSGNIPGAALPSVAQALLLKSPCLVKTASAEPLLLPLYARSIAERDPEVAQALAVAGWEGGRLDLERALLAEAEGVIVYGSNAAIRQLRAEAAPHARFVGYGHRISFSAAGRECLTREGAADLAMRAARDFAEFDQQGCLSPQALYLERGGEVSPAEFGDLLAVELHTLDRELPRRVLSPAEAAAIHQYRARVEMEALTDPEVRLWSSPDGTRWTVALERDPALLPCPLNRTAVLRPLDALEELAVALAHSRGLLLSAGLEAGESRRAELAALVARCGATRITRIGEAQRPRGALFHDGVDAIGTLARHVVVER